MRRIFQAHRLGHGRNAALVAAISLIAAAGLAVAAQDRYSLSVPGGLAFAEFKGYETWQALSVSKGDHGFALILANPAMIDAYKSGIPTNGKPFPDGARMAKIHWTAVKNAESPDPSTLSPGALYNVDFMVKDAKRFGDSGGWGWAAFQYDDASDTFRAADTGDQPPQEHDAKCGFACHTLVQSKDYVFTGYPKR
jgi:hypothetical protein